MFLTQVQDFVLGLTSGTVEGVSSSWRGSLAHQQQQQQQERVPRNSLHPPHDLYPVPRPHYLYCSLRTLPHTHTHTNTNIQTTALSPLPHTHARTNTQSHKYQQTNHLCLSHAHTHTNIQTYLPDTQVDTYKDTDVDQNTFLNAHTLIQDTCMLIDLNAPKTRIHAQIYAPPGTINMFTKRQHWIVLLEPGLSTAAGILRVPSAI